MDTKLIECKLIDVPKVDGAKRTFSKEFAVKLSDSIKIDGLLNPIVVRPNPNTPGRFILVAGRHRLYATKNVLKEQLIRATIDLEMDEAEADIAATVENLWRNPLSKAQTALALKHWHSHWLASLPVIEPKPAPAATSDQTDQAALPGPVDASEAANAEPAATGSREKDFNAKVAAVTGQSEVSVRRNKAIAKAFTEDQLEVFTQMEVSQTDMLTVANIKDETKRGEIVNLIASGMVPAEAVKEIMKDEAPKRYNSGTAAAQAAEAKEATKEQRAPELTEDEWFEQNCGEKAAMLGDPSKFKADALLFRSVADLRHAFRTKSKGFLSATKKAGVTGAFYNLVNRFISISHPKDWLICPECKGQGSVQAPSGIDGATCKCGKCFGGGYLLKTEEFL